ncbi:putative alcohol dehydrogenase adh [Streptomyces sp. RB5]|uniref:2-deoxy-scyllo-inosamine dehydrogenase n=1 Tax=Streptomyces smaragdinus TaxID=2585196 RepID=A0A7K0CLK7_9ACTN|nr:zinc-binding dehydrogenase [Streptomyces smaragdinus]MQY14301.1 putative alcohol dehydrogenase adh [Streptomyces smaragdinus]
MRFARASVMTGPRTMEIREFPLPALEPDDGLLKVEAAGVCGSDVKSFFGDLSPRILGHENVGTVSAIGRSAAQRWGLAEGDRVVLEEYLPCGHCDFCRSSEFRLCLDSDPSTNPSALRFGRTPLTVAPSLWGGFSDYLYLHPRTVAHRLPTHVPAVEASLALPISNGYEWVYREGRVRPGDVVVILGPGQQGLGATIAAKAAGAGLVIVTGLARDKERLEVARAFGADHTLYADDTDVLERIRELTNGSYADVVVDTAAGNESTLSLALDAVRKRGKVIVAAAAMRPLDGLDFFKINRKYLTVQGVRGHSYQAVEWAIDLIAGGRYPLHLMCSLEVGIDHADQAILATAGEGPTPAIHASVVPA